MVEMGLLEYLPRLNFVDKNWPIVNVELHLAYFGLPEGRFEIFFFCERSIGSY
jgi:hypothetical protein